MAKVIQYSSTYKNGDYRLEERDGDFYLVPPTPPALLEAHPEAFKSLSGAATAVVGARASGVRFWQLVGAPKVEPRIVARGGAVGGGKTAAVKADAAKSGKRTSTPEANDAAATRERRAHRPSAVKTRSPFERYKDQSGLEAGEVRWTCAVGLHHFVVNGSETPTSCPLGHGAQAVAVEAVATV